MSEANEPTPTVVVVPTIHSAPSAVSFPLISGDAILELVGRDGR
jgi:hypothetical protein